MVQENASMEYVVFPNFLRSKKTVVRYFLLNFVPINILQNYHNEENSIPFDAVIEFW